MPLAHLPLILSPLQLVTFAQLADLLARLAVQAVCAAAAVLSAQAGSARAALFPPLLLKEEGAVRRASVEWREREKPGLLVFGLDVFAERRRPPVLSRGARPRSGSGHGCRLLSRLVRRTIKKQVGLKTRKSAALAVWMHLRPVCRVRREVRSRISLCWREPAASMLI